MRPSLLPLAHLLGLSVHQEVPYQGGPPLYCLHAQSETATRLVARVALMLFPGFSDHMPCDYERALREELP